MKRVLLLSLCVLVLFGFVGCREKGSVPFENDISEEIIDNSTESQISAEELEKTEITDKSVIAGSACHQGKPSHVIAALKLSKKVSGGVIRLSFGPETDKGDIDACADALRRHHDTRMPML